MRSSLWHVVVRRTGPWLVPGSTPLTHPRQVIRRIPELRRGSSQTFRLRVHIPRSARVRSCLTAVALADSARPARARVARR